MNGEIMEILRCFKAYDIRGKLGDELNVDIAYRIGRAVAEYLQAKSVVVGADMRLSSESLKVALSDGLRDAGCDVIDIGMVGTEEVYFATRYLNADGGVEITASHNPADYNGMKLVREQSKPISGDTGLRDIQLLAEKNDFQSVAHKGQSLKKDTLEPYTAHLLSYIDIKNIKPLRIVTNVGNGAAGHVVDALEAHFVALGVPIEFIKVHHVADGHFPNGIPNPLLPERRADTTRAVVEHDADFAVAWDGDFDRCFLFDEKGNFIEGYYIVGLLAEAFLTKEPGAKIIHDPRLTWNTIDVVEKNKGIPIQCKTGHAFIKERMRQEDAIYGGEMSAHHYFRDFAYCDSGMIPWLLVAELLSVKGVTLSQMVQKRMLAYPVSGELNIELNNPQQQIALVKKKYMDKALVFDDTDGVSFEFEQWRFNLRCSNTEPVVRLNVESRGDEGLMRAKTKELLAMLQ